MKFEIALIRSLFPHCTNDNFNKFAPYFPTLLEKYNINTLYRLAAFCAQVEVESGSLFYVKEIASGEAYEHRKDLGNLTKEALDAAHAQGTTTGRFYKGHGLIQITGFYNHKQCGLALGLDLVNDPTLLCEPEYALESACWFWREHNCNELADVSLFGAITKIINGGYNHLKERIAAYNRNKQVLKIK
jgi:putative chitinase